MKTPTYDYLWEEYRWLHAEHIRMLVEWNYFNLKAKWKARRV